MRASAWLRHPTACARAGNNKTVAANFAQCESTAQRRAHQKRASIMGRLTMPDGQAAGFSRAAREKLPADTLDAIIAANWMDMELHALATSRITATVQRLEDAGLLEARPARRAAEGPTAC